MLNLTISLQRFDLRREEQIAECLKHSDVVYNLVGRDYETKYVNLIWYYNLHTRTYQGLEMGFIGNSNLTDLIHLETLILNKFMLKVHVDSLVLPEKMVSLDLFICLP